MKTCKQCGYLRIGDRKSEGIEHCFCKLNNESIFYLDTCPLGLWIRHWQEFDGFKIGVVVTQPQQKKRIYKKNGGWRDNDSNKKSSTGILMNFVCLGHIL